MEANQHIYQVTISNAHLLALTPSRILLRHYGASSLLLSLFLLLNISSEREKERKKEKRPHSQPAKMRPSTGLSTPALSYLLPLILIILHLNITPTTASPSPNPNPSSDPDLDPVPEPLVLAGAFIPFVPVIVNHNARRGEKQQDLTKPSKATRVTVTKSNGEKLHVYSGLTPQGYVYHGCYNETLDLPGTVGTRALYGGVFAIREGKMGGGGGGEGGVRDHHHRPQPLFREWEEKMREKVAKEIEEKIEKKINPGMTVKRCLKFCGGKEGYKFAGLEYAK